MDLDFFNINASNNKPNLFSAQSNPSLYINNQESVHKPTVNKIEFVKTLRESPRSSFKRRQGSGNQLSQKSKTENIYENLRSIKGDLNAYKFFSTKQDTVNKFNLKKSVPFNNDRIGMKDVVKHRPHSVASYIIDGEEITPLETSM